MPNFEVVAPCEKNGIPIIYSCTNGFAPYVSVAIQSLINHISDLHFYDIIILERGINEEFKKLILAQANNRKNISIRFINISKIVETFDHSSLELSLPFETYFGIIAPFILKEYKKIICINVDTLVRSDIAELFYENLDNQTIGGVVDIFINGAFELNYKMGVLSGKTMPEYFNQVLKKINHNRYINGGLLTIDCVQYRAKETITSLIEIAKKEKFVFCDQDVVNILFKDDITLLDPKWNTAVITNSRSQILCDSSTQRVHDAYCNSCKNPSLLHWGGKPKPWICPDVPFGSEWWQTAVQTPFIGHIIARMVDGLITRKEYYKQRYGQAVAAWEPVPKNIIRPI